MSATRPLLNYHTTSAKALQFDHPMVASVVPSTQGTLKLPNDNSEIDYFSLMLGLFLGLFLSCDKIIFPALRLPRRQRKNSAKIEREQRDKIRC